MFPNSEHTTNPLCGNLLVQLEVTAFTFQFRRTYFDSNHCSSCFCTFDRYCSCAMAQSSATLWSQSRDCHHLCTLLLQKLHNGDRIQHDVTYLIAAFLKFEPLASGELNQLSAAIGVWEVGIFAPRIHQWMSKPRSGSEGCRVGASFRCTLVSLQDASQYVNAYMVRHLSLIHISEPTRPY